MKQSEDLRRLLESIDRKSYPAYKSAQGAYQFGNFTLSIDHVQGDPFAAPSKVSITVAHQKAGYPVDFLISSGRKRLSRTILSVSLEKKLPNIILKRRVQEKAA